MTNNPCQWCGEPTDADEWEDKHLCEAMTCECFAELGYHDWEDVLEGPVTVDRVCLACGIRASDLEPEF